MKWSPQALGWSVLQGASAARSDVYAYCKCHTVFLALLWTKLWFLVTAVPVLWALGDTDAYRTYLEKEGFG